MFIFNYVMYVWYSICTTLPAQVIDMRSFGGRGHSYRVELTKWKYYRAASNNQSQDPRGWWKVFIDYIEYGCEYLISQFVLNQYN